MCNINPDQSKGGDWFGGLINYMAQYLSREEGRSWKPLLLTGLEVRILSVPFIIKYRGGEIGKRLF